ncbi:MAG TPA: hypothetical protein VGI74_20870 [Streptosporangiaceae bacterium]
MTEKAGNVGKKDPAVTIWAADRLLAVTANPLHRQILENYRRHAILEVTANWRDIFVPDMTVPEPVYTFDVTGLEGVKLTGDEVKEFYKSLVDQQLTVILVEDEQLMVSDWGLASESWFNTYERGSALIGRGFTGYAADGYYVMRQRLAMIWPFDSRGRLIGEHVFEAKAFQQVIEVAEDDFVTLEDAQARLLPLLRPLPKFDPDAA